MRRSDGDCVTITTWFRLRLVVPSKGLEPPHPCEYMDLNHARLPIPPRWQSLLQSDLCSVAIQTRTTVSILQRCCGLSNCDYSIQLCQRSIFCSAAFQ